MTRLPNQTAPRTTHYLLSERSSTSRKRPCLYQKQRAELQPLLRKGTGRMPLPRTPMRPHRRRPDHDHNQTPGRMKALFSWPVSLIRLQSLYGVHSPKPPLPLNGAPCLRRAKGHPRSSEQLAIASQGNSPTLICPDCSNASLAIWHGRRGRQCRRR